MILPVALHMIENSDLNSSILELPLAAGYSPNYASKYCSCGLMARSLGCICGPSCVHKRHALPRRRVAQPTKDLHGSPIRLKTSVIVPKFAYCFTGNPQPIIPMLKTKVLHLCICAVPLSWEDWEDFIPTWTSPTVWVHRVGYTPEQATFFFPYYYSLIDSHRYPPLLAMSKRF